MSEREGWKGAGPNKQINTTTKRKTISKLNSEKWMPLINFAHKRQRRFDGESNDWLNRKIITFCSFHAILFGFVVFSSPSFCTSSALRFEHRNNDSSLLLFFLLLLARQFIRLYERCCWHLTYSIFTSNMKKTNSHWKSVTNWIAVSLSLPLAHSASTFSNANDFVAFFLNHKIVWIKLTGRIRYKLFSACLITLWRIVFSAYKIVISNPAPSTTAKKTGNKKRIHLIVGTVKKAHLPKWPAQPRQKQNLF